MNIIQIYRQFPQNKDCIKYLESLRWPNGAVCPYCQSDNSCKSGNRHHCNECNVKYSVTVNTLFHHTHLDLQRWFLAIMIITNAKKGISSMQLSRDIGVSKNTAWSMQMRIRRAMKQGANLLTGVIEMDETYVGGKGHKGKPGIRGRGTSKTPVIGMVERGGDVKAIAHPARSLAYKDLMEFTEKNVDLPNSMILTDEYSGYSRYSSKVRHKTINHSQNYVDCLVHTNTIEGFWGLVKRGIKGQYHRVSEKYLQCYIDEFCFKYNNRNNPDMFNTVLRRAVGC